MFNPKRKLIHDEEFFHKGFKFKVEFEDDNTGRAPWEDNDGAGIVSDWTRRDKHPGERILCSDGKLHRFYDWQETMKKAKRDGWGIAWDPNAVWQQNKRGKAPAKKWTEFEWKLWYQGLTRGQKAELAVNEDFATMRAWCDNQWCYVGVVVTHVRTGWVESLCGVESYCDEYIVEVAEQLADEIISKVRSSHPKAA